jgi:hypothetical protein
LRKYLVPTLIALGLVAAGCGSDNSGRAADDTAAVSP